ncbi:MAG: hypothetical protein ACP5E3_12305 [Bacteroidales bacterium]
MYRKYLLLPLFALSATCLIKGQMLPEDYADPVLINFIENKTSYKDSDPLPEKTEFGDKQLNYPWLYLEKQEWENLSSYLKDPYFKAVHERNLLSLQKLARGKKIIYKRDVDSVIPERTPRRTLKQWLEGATVAWYITQDTIYLEIAKRALSVACNKEDWGVAVIGRSNLNSADLRTGELMYIVSFGYDALFPYLDEELKRQCIKSVIEKGLRNYLEGHLTNDWWIHCDFNWNSAMHGNAGIAAMVIREANPELSDYVLSLVTKGLPYMISAFYPGGGYIEGVMYLGTAIGHLTDFIVPFRKLTNNYLGLFENEDFHNTLTFWIPMFAPDGRAYNFSDCHEDENLYGIPQGFWWAHQLDHPEWAWDQERRTPERLGKFGLFSPVESFWFRKVNQEILEPDIPRFIHFKGIDWAIWKGKNSWLAFRAGFNGGNHDNDDLGHFILGYGADRFLIDPGYGAPSASQHNCFTLRGMQQTDCATAPITESFEHENGFYLLSDIQQAFPLSTSYYKRHLLLIDDEHLLLLDEIKGKDNLRVSAKGHFQTRYPVEQTDNGWLIQGPNETCRIELLFDHSPLQETKWNFGGPITMLNYWNFSDRVHSIQPIMFSFNDEPYSYKKTPGGFTIEIKENIHEFKFNERRELVYSGVN